jgi:hypothetical protein
MTEVTDAHGLRGRTEEHTGEEAFSEEARKERVEADGDTRS